VTPNLSRRLATVSMRVRNSTGNTLSATIQVQASAFNTASRHSASTTQTVELSPGEQVIDEQLSMGPGMLTWDEFEPALYSLTATLYRAGSRNSEDQTTTEFGMREVTVSGTMISVNGRNVFVRGRHDSGVFPLTGFPPMDVESWAKYFRVVKSYGLNHVRFHSWCPPRAAF
jgi:beta-galactosidase/beta-glucuronidase